MVPGSKRSRKWRKRFIRYFDKCGCYACTRGKTRKADLVQRELDKEARNGYSIYE